MMGRERNDESNVIFDIIHSISKSLGWQNNLFGENKEPKYKIMVKNFWVPEALIEQWIPKKLT